MNYQPHPLTNTELSTLQSVVCFFSLFFYISMTLLTSECHRDAKLLTCNMSLGSVLTSIYINSGLLLMIRWWNSSNILDFKLLLCCEYCFLSFGLSPSVWISCANILEHCFISIGLVSKKNNWGEIARVFVQVEVWLKGNLDQSEGGGMGLFLR